MSKARLYLKLKRGWREWDEDVYLLASSMVTAFQGVVENAQADPSFVAELQNLQWQVEQYEFWRGQKSEAS